MSREYPPTGFKFGWSPAMALKKYRQQPDQAVGLPDRGLAGDGTAVAVRDDSEFVSDPFSVSAGTWEQPDAIVVAPPEPFFQFGDFVGPNRLTQEEVLLQREHGLVGNISECAEQVLAPANVGSCNAVHCCRNRPLPVTGIPGDE